MTTEELVDAIIGCANDYISLGMAITKAREPITILIEHNTYMREDVSVVRKPREEDGKQVLCLSPLT